jgi:predicted Zn-ribbon and HTH transcriptional regulator
MLPLTLNRVSRIPSALEDRHVVLPPARKPASETVTECRYCGFEPQGTVPRRCPKCHGSTWIRLTRLSGHDRQAPAPRAPAALRTLSLRRAL